MCSDPQIFHKELERMANLKRNMIELVKNPDEVLKGGEVEVEKYWTPAFIPFSVIRDAVQVQTEIEKGDMTELEMIDKLADFVANNIYAGQFTKDDIYNRLHAPNGTDELQAQLMFVANGQQSDSTKKFLEKKN